MSPPTPPPPRPMRIADKNGVEEFGLEWHLLCREITKQLNAKLELYK